MLFRSVSRGQSFIAARFDSKAYLGLHLTVAIIIAVLGLWLFGTLLDAVLDNALIVKFDLAAAEWIHGSVTATGLTIFNGITQLGSPTAMVGLAVIGGVILAVKRRWTMLIGWLAAFVGGTIIDQLLKNGVARNRPNYGAAYLHGHSFSFPSGHAMGSIIGYSMLVYVLFSYWHPGALTRRTLTFLAGAMVIAVGVSRVYLGVHYPSDVIGGFAAGAAWAAVCVSGIGIALHHKKGPQRLIDGE